MHGATPPVTPPALTVVKIGGSLELDEAGPLLSELAAFPEALVVVHGAHLQLDRLASRLGHPPRIVESVRGEVTRYTDTETMDHFLMAYCGLVNKRLVEGLRQRGADAVGLSAMDGGIAVGRRRPDLRFVQAGRTRVLHDDHAGTIEAVDVSLLRLLLDAGRLPVLTPPAISRGGEALNVDGDRLAALVAVALSAGRLVILMNVPGLLRDPADPGSVVTRLRPREIPAHLPLAGGRARVKLLAAQHAAEGGVGAVVLGDGRGDRPLARCLAGAGTWIGESEQVPAER
jgi:[amino group carrier protein]-L-2-aminoadipate 6-kinase